MTSIYVNLFLNTGEAPTRRDSLSSFPKTLGVWEGSDQSFSIPILLNLGVDEYLMRRFSNGKDTIWLYIGYYGRQREGAVPHSPLHCYPGTGFNPITRADIRIPVQHKDKTEIHPNYYVFQKGMEREIVIYWYQSRGRAIANEYIEKIYLIWDAIFRNRTDGALVRFSISTTAGMEKTEGEKLAAFVAEIYPYLPRYIPD